MTGQATLTRITRSTSSARELRTVRRNAAKATHKRSAPRNSSRRGLPGPILELTPSSDSGASTCSQDDAAHPTSPSYTLCTDQEPLTYEPTSPGPDHTPFVKPRGTPYNDLMPFDPPQYDSVTDWFTDQVSPSAVATYSSFSFRFWAHPPTSSPRFTTFLWEWPRQQPLRCATRRGGSSQGRIPEPRSRSIHEPHGHLPG